MDCTEPVSSWFLPSNLHRCNKLHVSDFVSCVSAYLWLLPSHVQYLCSSPFCWFTVKHTYCDTHNQRYFSTYCLYHIGLGLVGTIRRASCPSSAEHACRSLAQCQSGDCGLCRVDILAEMPAGVCSHLSYRNSFRFRTVIHRLKQSFRRSWVFILDGMHPNLH